MWYVLGIVLFVIVFAASRAHKGPGRSPETGRSRSSTAGSEVLAEPAACNIPAPGAEGSPEALLRDWRPSLDLSPPPVRAVPPPVLRGPLVGQRSVQPVLPAYWGELQPVPQVRDAVQTIATQPPSALADTGRAIAIQPSTPPDAVYGRWIIRYRDFNGDETTRTVRIIAVRPRLEKLECWCELRADYRTFNFYGVLSFTDAETGEIVNLRSWVTAYNRSRRKAT